MSTPRLVAAAAALLLGALTGGCRSAPPYQGMSPEEIFEAGVREFEAGKWDSAIRALERVLYADPAFRRTAEARFYLGQAYFEKKEYLTAVSEYTRILDRHPGHSLAPRAALGICGSYVELSPHVQRDQSYTEQAVVACENVITDFGTHEVVLEALEHRDRMREKLAQKLLIGGEYYYGRKYYDSGILYFNLVLERYPRSEAAAQALLRLYQSYTHIRWEREANEARERLLREFPDSPAARELRANGEDGG